MTSSRLAADGLRRSRGVKLLRPDIGRVEGLLEALGSLTRRLVLRYEILGGAGYAVIVGPAIDHRQLFAKVAVLRRRVGRLPFQRCGAPGVATRRLAVEITPDQVVNEHQLDGT